MTPTAPREFQNQQRRGKVTNIPLIVAEADDDTMRPRASAGQHNKRMILQSRLRFPDVQKMIP